MGKLKKRLKPDNNVHHNFVTQFLNALCYRLCFLYYKLVMLHLPISFK